MKTNKNDPKYSYIHTKKRLEERYGYKDLTEVEYQDMCIKCIQGEKINTEVTPKGNQDTYTMLFNQLEIIVVYQTWKNQISTVLTLK